MAPPEMNDSYPLFRRPINQRELKAMMQSNDMFIQVLISSSVAFLDFMVNHFLEDFGQISFAVLKSMKL